MKHILLSILLLSGVITAMAQKVSVDDARGKAAQFLKKSGKMRKVAGRNAELTLARCDAERIYVFNVGEDDGYVIVSGDSRTRAILGYGHGHGFDMDKAPENMKALFREYDHAISQIEGMNMQAAAEPEAETYGKAIEPLLKSTWNQSEPYNNLCPLYNGERCITGCVATALAQVLYYWKAPQHWVSGIPAYIVPQQPQPFIIDEIPHTKLRWDEMCDTYEPEDKRTEAQNSAVAELMRYCGQAVGMLYSPTSSGAVDANVPKALTTYFGFAESARLLRRNDYTIKEWESILYDNLSRGIPVIYSGNSTNGGHSFVCDGYDGNGMFHINWGWGGSYDDYVLLSLLNPYTTFNFDLGYNLFQTMVVDAVPADHPVGEVPSLSDPVMDISQDTLITHVLNGYVRDAVYEMALATKDAEGNLTPVVKDGDSANGPYVQAIKVGYYLPFKFNMAEAGLKDGTYDLYPIYRCVSVPGDTWHTVLGERFVRTVVDGTSLTMTMMPAMNLVVEDIQNTNEGYAYEIQRLILKLRNNSDMEHNNCLNIAITYDGDEEKQYSQDAYTFAGVPAGGTAEQEIFVAPNKGGNATFTITSDQEPSVVVSTHHITFKEPRQEFIDAFSVPEYRASYTVNDDGDLAVDFHYLATNTFNGMVIRNIIVTVADGDNMVTKPIGMWAYSYNRKNSYDTTLTFSAGELAEAGIGTGLSEGIDLALCGQLGIGYNPFLTIHIPYGKIVTQDGEMSGINDIINIPAPDAKRSAIIYDLQGRRLNGVPSRGLYIRNGKKHRVTDTF